MKNKKNIEEINSLLSALNHKIKDIDVKAQENADKKNRKPKNFPNKHVKEKNLQNENNLSEKPVFQTKIFKHPELIFKGVEENNENIQRLPIIQIKNKENNKNLLLPKKNDSKKIWPTKCDLPKTHSKPSTLEEVESRIKDLHLRSENALLRFVEIRQDLIKVKGKCGE